MSTGRGISCALAYVLGQGNHPETGRRLAIKPGQQSRAEIIGGQNFGFEIDDETIEFARRMMEWNAHPDRQAGTSAHPVTVDCFHLSLSWDKGDKPAREEMERAARSALASLGMAEALALFVAHHDRDHSHIHVVASRLDPNTGKPFDTFKTMLKAQGWAVRYEMETGRVVEARRELHNLVNAIDARNTAGVLAYLTKNEATFDAKTLDRALTYGITDKDERYKFALEVRADHEVIAQRAAIGEEVTHYTTRSVLRLENTVLDAAAAMADRRDFAVKERRLAAIETSHTLIPEQAAALRHATKANGIALIAGEAGSGKSHTLGAIRESYEQTGRRVIGLSWTNQVVRAMDGDGFKEARTIKAELKRQEKGIDAWSRRTVLMVDEAAMLSTKALAELMGRAKQTGAKVILVGDAAQLGSIEHGGMFSVLAAQHGAATLRQVMRTKDADYQAAWNEMHEGNYLSALKRLDKKGDINWSATQQESMRALRDKYAADVAADPNKDRMIFAHTNADVDALNKFARDVSRAQGKLGPDVKVTTATGEVEFAVGDRIQFTANGASKEAKRAGYVNGQGATIKAIEQGASRMTVQLDGKKGSKPKLLTFEIGEDREAGQWNAIRHAYASTVYKGQGATLDQSYVFHSQGWKSATSYVALSRARERVSLFASKSVVTETEPWMQKTGGLAELDETLAASARRSFDAWKEENPEAAQRYGLARYVSYVQDQWASSDHSASDIEKLARMMSRSEAKKAASAFISSEIVPPEAFVVAAREGSVFHRAAEALRRRFGLEEQKQQGNLEKEAQRTLPLPPPLPTPAPTPDDTTAPVVKRAEPPPRRSLLEVLGVDPEEVERRWLERRRQQEVETAIEDLRLKSPAARAGFRIGRIYDEARRVLEEREEKERQAASLRAWRADMERDQARRRQRQEPRPEPEAPSQQPSPRPGMSFDPD